jgi:hypothetical protein
VFANTSFPIPFVQHYVSNYAFETMLWEVYQSTWLIATIVLCLELKLYQPRSDDSEDVST